MRTRILHPSRIGDWVHNSLHLKVVLKTINTFLSPKATLLVSTEGDGSVEHIIAVDPHTPRSECTAERVGRIQALGVNPGC